MILLLALVLAVFWAVIRGGRLDAQPPVPLAAYALALAAFGLQAVVIYVPLPYGNGMTARLPLLALSYLLLAAFVWQIRGLPGVWLIGAGFLANGAVILANGGSMPVTLEALTAAGKAHLLTSTAVGTFVSSSKDILLPLAETRLWFLSDIFVIPPPFPLSSVFSVGDALIALGLFWLVPFLFGAPPVGRNHAANSETI